ncbi:MAG: tetratricopeptide repeat protein [Myxococcales bacterium]|nr:tetratricopeptide repeat protein [Myxococcales bacterium]
MLGVRILPFLFLTGALCLFRPGQAFADDIAEFESGRSAYLNQNYEEAVEILESLVGERVPRTNDRVILVEALKYLGASYLFLGKKAEAEDRFERLIRKDIYYEIDPIAFPSAVVDAFESVRERIRRIQAAEARREREESEKREQQRLKDWLEHRGKMLELQDLAKTDYVEVHNSRLIAAIPFGVGQFQNGHDALGTGLAISEGLLAVTSITTYFLHESLRNETPTAADRNDAEALRDGFQVANWLSAGILGLVAVVGVIDAQSRFVPVFRTEKPRELPEDLEDAVQRELVPQPEISFGPGSISGRF